MENHDEPHVATTFAPGMHKVAAVMTYLSQGMRFFHQGPFEGGRKHISPHLARGPEECADPELKRFYASLLVCGLYLDLPPWSCHVFELTAS
jgi:hypothetical protein